LSCICPQFWHEKGARYEQRYRARCPNSQRHKRSIAPVPRNPHRSHQWQTCVARWMLSSFSLYLRISQSMFLHNSHSRLWLLAEIGFYARIRSVQLNSLTLAGNSEISVPATRRRRGAGQILPGEIFAVWDLLSGRWSISRCGPAPGLIYSIEAVSSLGHQSHEWLRSKNGHWSFLCLVSLIIFALKTVDGAAVWDKFGTQIL
jgi:hypothetical protein